MVASVTGYDPCIGRLWLFWGQGTFEGMSSPIIILGPDNSSLPFCDVDCFQTYTFYQDQTNQIGAKKLNRSPGNCFHCAGCGRIVYATEGCLIHEEFCPDWVWYASYPNTHDFMDVYIAHQGEEIPPIAWDTADRIAEKNTLISGADLAIMTMERLRLL